MSIMFDNDRSVFLDPSMPNYGRVSAARTLNCMGTLWWALAVYSVIAFVAMIVGLIYHPFLGYAALTSMGIAVVLCVPVKNMVRSYLIRKYPVITTGNL